MSEKISVFILNKLPDHFNIYRKFILDHIHLLPNYYLRRDTFDDCYAEKDGGEASAKAILLRSKLADGGTYDLINYDLLLGE
jgi:hypothetical protein